MRAHIKAIETYLPEQVISNAWIEEKLHHHGFEMPSGMLQKMMGSQTRHFAAANEQASDLAANAARKIMAQHPEARFDLLIFASACADMIEPATSAIVQHKLGLQCATFDLKNACNSVTNAIEVASALLAQGLYQNILIVSGEKPSDSILFEGITKENLKDRFAAFSFGDAGVALWMTLTNQDRGFFYHKQQTFGQHWPLCRIAGGGSVYPHSPEHLYFSGDTFGLKSAIDQEAPKFVLNCLKEAQIHPQQIKRVCTHQVSMGIYKDIAKGLGKSLDEIEQTFARYGNTASASLPIALYETLKSDKTQAGDIIMLLGFAAGINISVQLMRV